MVRGAWSAERTRGMNTAVGLYVHIPFCLAKCRYCDFCSFPAATEATKDVYVAALCRQIAAWGEKFPKITADTVYFGGGTPTTLSLSHWDAILQALRGAFPISPDAEITTEINPATADGAYLRHLYALGLNRLSIGVQSAREDELRALGRLHDFPAAAETVRLGREAGFTNISADIMLGIPHQTRESLAATLDALTSLPLTHLSAYLLKVEPGTPFGKMAEAGKLVLPDEDVQCDLYLDTVARLGAAGFAPYEISNFAKAGYESRHNLKYWIGAPYIGFGVAAHSDFGGRRFAAPTDIQRYLDGNYTAASRVIGENERKNEYLMLRMRLVSGIDKADYAHRFGEDFDAAYHTMLLPYIRAGLLHDTAETIRFTPEGMLLSNTVLAELTDFSAETDNRP